MMKKRALAFILLTCAALIAAPIAWLYARDGVYGINVVLLRGGSVWPSMGRDDPRLTRAARLALKGAVGVPGPLTWSEPRAGFEVGELPVLVNGEEVDRLHLARIDPARWRFSVHSAPAGDHDLDGWMRELGAALVDERHVDGAQHAIGHGRRPGDVQEMAPGKTRCVLRHVSSLLRTMRRFRMAVWIPRCACRQRGGALIPEWRTRVKSSLRRTSAVRVGRRWDDGQRQLI